MRVEYMGIAGLSWSDKVVSAAKGYLKPVKKDSLINSNVLDVLHRAYLAEIVSGKSPPVYKNGLPDSGGIRIGAAIAKKVTMDLDVVHAFLRALYEQSLSGKIPYAKYSPKEYARLEAIRKTLPTEKSSVAEFAKGALGGGKVLLVAALLGTLGFFIMQGKTFLPKEK